MLPVELYLSIIQHVDDPHDLAALLTTSRICQAVAERQLYHSLDIFHHEIIGKEWQARKLVPWSILNHINTCKRVALLVKTVQYTMAKPAQGELEATELNKITTFIDALSQMDNLKVLCIYKHSANSGTLLSLNLNKQFPFQLHTFYLRGTRKEKAPALFLQSQPEIRELNCYLPGDVILPTQILPNLRSLAIQSSQLSPFEEPTLTQLVTECPITHIQIRQSLTQPLAQILSRSRSPIVALSNIECFTIKDYLPEYFPHLRFLECYFDLGDRSQSITSLSQLKNLTRLRILALEEEAIADLVPDLFWCNASLTHIDEMISSEEGYIWERGKGRQEEVVFLLWNTDL